MELSVEESDRVVREMPKEYWLKGAMTQHLLACIVHRRNKEIVTQCSLLPAGKLRENQRRNAASRVANDQANARKKHESDDVEEMKAKRIRLMIGQGGLITTKINAITAQVELYNRNKSSLVSAMGQEAYDNKILELISQLPNPNLIPDGHVNVDENDDDSNDKEEED